MSVDFFEKAVIYIREAQELALFTTMADARLSSLFRASPLFYVILPFIAFLLTASAFINGYHLIKAHNRNFDLWAHFMTSSVCAALASMSLYGTALSTLLGFTFTAGPWFFLASMVIAASHQLSMLAVNLRRSYDSLKDTNMRKHFMQAAVGNLTASSLIAMVIGALVFVLLFPAVSPMAGSFFSLSAVALTTTNMLWRLAPANVKIILKRWFHLDKSESLGNDEQQLLPSAISLPVRASRSSHHYQPLFSSLDYSAEIRKMNINIARVYLLKIIAEKQQVLEEVYQSAKDEKTSHKLALLKILCRVLEQKVDINLAMNKWNLLKKYPMAFQSFWVRKADIEQIFDAVIVFQEQSRKTPDDELTEEELTPGMVLE